MVDFNGFDKGVIGKPLPAASTLGNMKKYELVELSRYMCMENIWVIWIQSN